MAIYAKPKDEGGWTLGTLEELLPNASAPSDGYICSQGLLKVNVFLPHDRATQYLATCEPYELNGWAYTVKVADLSSEQIAANAASAQVKLVKQLTDAIQGWLDRTVQQRGYDGILSACSYATSTNPKFAAEGQACIAWRDHVWTACNTILNEVQAGTHSVPTAESLIGFGSMNTDPVAGELPVMIWPS